VPDAPVDPEEVASTIAYLSTRTDEDFAEALADCIVDPLPAEVAAFRSSELAYRSLVAARYLIKHANTTMEHREGDASVKWKQRRTARFRDRVGMERRLLEQIVAGDNARSGRVSNAPSAQSRALRRLKQRHLAEFQELKREEQAKIDAEAKERREQRKRERAAERARV
jgi:hypothetical protein